MSNSSNTKNRGFASMSSDKQREIARKGGRAAHEKGTAHEFTADEARAAGRKGGESVSANREHMSRIGRLGGKSSAGRRSTQPQSSAESNPGEEPAAASEVDAAGRARSDESGTAAQPGQSVH